jgi:hypothetical protein
MKLLPEFPYAWFVWTIISASEFMVLAHYTEVNPFLSLISFPMLGQIWLGQTDVLACFGIGGIAIHQESLLAQCWHYFSTDETPVNRAANLLLDSSRTLSYMDEIIGIPLVVVLVSLMVYGFNWPNAWVRNALTDLPVHVWRFASIDVWRMGILLFPLPLLPNTKRKRLLAGLYVSSLATPFYGVYSYALFLLFDVKSWSIVLSYGWLLGFFFLRGTAVRFAWTLLLGMLIHLLYVEWRGNWSARESQTETQ